MELTMSVTKMSGKGQICIPVDMRKEFETGEKILIIKHKNMLILENAKHWRRKLEEDLVVAKRVEEAYRKFDKGEFKSMSMEDFLEKIKSW